MSKTMSFRLDDVHVALLEEMVKKLESEGVKTNKTDVVQKALYSFARESVLDPEVITGIIDKYYQGFLKE